jgi:hypothetical protein
VLLIKLMSMPITISTFVFSVLEPKRICVFVEVQCDEIDKTQQVFSIVFDKQLILLIFCFDMMISLCGHLSRRTQRSHLFGKWFSNVLRLYNWKQMQSNDFRFNFSKIQKKNRKSHFHIWYYKSVLNLICCITERMNSWPQWLQCPFVSVKPPLTHVTFQNPNPNIIEITNQTEIKYTGGRESDAVVSICHLFFLFVCLFDLICV